MARRKRLILEGPAAEAVERLARSSNMTPAEVIRSALQREDAAQRSEQEPARGEHSSADQARTARRVRVKDLEGTTSAAGRSDKPGSAAENIAAGLAGNLAHRAIAKNLADAFAETFADSQDTQNRGAFAGTPFLPSVITRYASPLAQQIQDWRADGIATQEILYRAAGVLAGQGLTESEMQVSGGLIIAMAFREADLMAAASKETQRPGQRTQGDTPK